VIASGGARVVAVVWAKKKKMKMKMKLTQKTVTASQAESMRIKGAKNRTTEWTPMCS